MAKPLPHLLSLSLDHLPPRGHNSARRRPVRADPHAVRRPTKKYTGARAPSLAVLAALATLAGAAPLDDVATTSPVPRPISADVPDFLCPALASSPATTSAGFSATLAAQSSRSAVETTTAPPPTPQQQQQQRLAFETSYLSACNGGPVVTHIPVDSDLNTYAVVHAPDTRAIKDAANNSNRRRRRTRSSRSLPDSLIKFPQDESKLYSVFTPTLSFSSTSSKTQIARGDATTYSSTPSPSSTECSELYTSRTIPDRYELGNDGRWHKLGVWSSCTLCQCDTQTSHDVDDSADNEISATGVTNDSVGDDEQDLSNVSATASSTPTDSSNPAPVVLPVGWDRRSDSAVYRVPLIVIASLLVAIAVCCAVWFTFFWRRRRRLARQLAQARDLENKRRKAEGIESGSEEDIDDDGDDDGNGRRSLKRRGDTSVYADGERREKKDEGRAKARWARATAQWKAHARWIARRRRGRAGIVDGMRHREDAMASGVSLARSTASSRASSRNEAAAATRISRDGGEAGRQVELELPPGTEEEEAVGRDPMPGIRVRAGDGPMTENRSGGALRDPEISSEGSRIGMVGGSNGQDQLRFRNENQALGRNEDHQDLGGGREVEAEGEAAVINANQCPSGGSGAQLPRPRSRIGEVNIVPHTSGLPLSRYPSRHPLSTSELRCSRDYDHPPLESDEEQGESMSPPAYRVRGIAHGSGVPRTGRRRTRTRIRRDQKSASGPGYVPHPEDCAPYTSSEDEYDDDSGSTISTRDDGTSPVETNMHIAVDDKHALARLTEYASAPPPLSPSSPPTTTATSPSSPSSHAHSQQLPEANAPPETEWFKGYAAAVCDDDMTADSPGAGPGPSTVFARAASPSSSRSGSPSRSRMTESHVQAQSGACSLFPAPPQPVTSRLAYAPADAGLRLDHSDFGFDATVNANANSDDSKLTSEDAHMQRYHDFSCGFDFDLGLGLDSDEEVDDMMGGMLGPSAPPFEDALADASAPPMFFEEDGRMEDEHAHTVANDCQLDNNSSPLPPPDIVHTETSDRNAVLSAVR